MVIVEDKKLKIGPLQETYAVYSKRTNTQWHRLKTKYKKAIGKNKILARNLNNIYEQFGL
ncbi:MAG: hypothetical protein BAA00_10665 [Parageobacillus thermoglucosidasius]|nr:MAG: hypothetical protein BAA00_10665 [Parageobacillus thermoglucosidasius]